MADRPGRTVSAWLGQLAVIAALLGYAIIAIGSAFDRAAPDHPELARWVPSRMQAAAPAARARQFIESGLPGAALAPALAALRTDPVEPGSSALYGTALLARGQARRADQAFRVAARLGWREPLTQVYWMETAISSGDMRAAVLRFDVLARQYPEAPAMTLAANRLESSEAGRAALAQRLAQGGAWAQSYAQIDRAGGADKLRARGDVLIETGRLGRRLGCEPIARVVRALAAVDPFRGATLWREHCPDAAGAGAIADGGFEAIVARQERVPFEWALTGNGDLSVVTIPARQAGAGSGQVLQMNYSGAATIPVLAQLVPLSPGTYRVVWQGDSRGRLRAELSCGTNPDMPPARSGSGQVFEVDASCPARWLRLWLAPGAEQVTLDTVAVERL